MAAGVECRGEMGGWWERGLMLLVWRGEACSWVQDGGFSSGLFLRTFRGVVSVTKT